MPGGAVIPIPPQIERAIGRMAPNADWHSIRSAAVNFQLERDHLPKAESPSETRTVLSGIIDRAILLRRDLMMLREESTEAVGGWPIIHATADQLSLLINEGKAGHNEIEPKGGRPASLRKGFVRNIAGILSAGGYEIDSKPNGLLVPIVSELLDLYGEKPADVPAMVRDAIRENPSERA